MAGTPARKHLEPVRDDDKQGDNAEAAAAEPDKLEAATGEVIDNTTVRAVSWRGLELIVPLEIPPVLMFDFIAMENDQGAMSLMRMFHTLLDTEQFVQVRNVIGKLDGKEQISAITELSEVIMDSYGTTLGESEASEAS